MLLSSKWERSDAWGLRTNQTITDGQANAAVLFVIHREAMRGQPYIQHKQQLMAKAKNTAALAKEIGVVASNPAYIYQDNTNRSIGAILVMQASCCLLGGLSPEPKYRLG